MKPNEDIESQSFLVVGGGHKFAPHHTNVCKLSQLYGV